MIQKFRNFSVGVPQFEITGRPETSFNLLWISGKRYILPKQLVFLKLYDKYLSSFSLINLSLYNRLKNLLPFSVNWDSNLPL